LPYDLTRLQADANRIYGYSVKDTLAVMQSLYETHKVLTYPRTDSQYLSSDLAETLPERVKACAIPAFRKICAKLSGNTFVKSAFYIDNSKVSDHHAIIPTEQSPDLTSMNDKERKIYELVVKRFLAALMPPFEYTENRITLMLDGEAFNAKGGKIKNLGFREVFSDMNDDDNTTEIPVFTKSELLNNVSFGKTSGKTKPPAYFTEATLLIAMENPSSFLDGADKSLAKTLDVTGGIGTVATRADIMDKLFNNFVIEKRGNEIFTTQKGRQLLKLVPKEMISPALTAVWEQRLERIAKNNESPEGFITEMKEYTHRIIRDIKGSGASYAHENLTRERCPECGKFMLAVNSKKGRLLICQDRDCGYRQNVSIITNARCPNCHKRMELSGGGEKKFFLCVCGHKESEEQFEKRVKEKGNQMNRRDVEAYIKNREREDTGNKAFAAAFAKLKGE
ncbi:MAG: DNA topoisomerase III, partial [Clostridiales bacterium]|nr:DNA topoisomerase III [Clostridiales bacterium]